MWHPQQFAIPEALLKRHPAHTSMAANPPANFLQIEWRLRMVIPKRTLAL
jgi:hypothetical protein